jgi:hypothetical protein
MEELGPMTMIGRWLTPLHCQFSETAYFSRPGTVILGMMKVFVAYLLRVVRMPYAVWQGLVPRSASLNAPMVEDLLVSVAYMYSRVTGGAS